MASFSVVIRKSAVDELLAVPFPFRRQINARIFKLKATPRPVGAELVVEDERYRLQVAAWWLLYEIDDAAELITIVSIQPVIAEG